VRERSVLERGVSHAESDFGAEEGDRPHRSVPRQVVQAEAGEREVIVAVQRVVLERADDRQLTGERPGTPVLCGRGAETDVRCL